MATTDLFPWSGRALGTTAERGLYCCLSVAAARPQSQVFAALFDQKALVVLRAITEAVAITLAVACDQIIIMDNFQLTAQPSKMNWNTSNYFIRTNLGWN